MKMHYLKENGMLPWRFWYDNDEYKHYKHAMQNYFKPLEEAESFYGQLCPNVTRLSTDAYNYYIKNEHFGFMAKNFTTVITIGSGHRNETKWVVHQMEKVNSRLHDDKENITKEHPEFDPGFYRFAFVEHRYDEPVSEAFVLRRYPSTFVIDGQTEKVYAWDKYEYPTEETLFNWIMNKTYLQSYHNFPVPVPIRDGEYMKPYAIKWIRENFGDRFCWWVYKVPGLKYACFMFCDHNQSDVHRHKEDRFTVIAFPVFVIWIGIPWTLKLIKWSWNALIWCCTVNEYVEEEEEDLKKD